MKVQVTDSEDDLEFLCLPTEVIRGIKGKVIEARKFGQNNEVCFIYRYMGKDCNWSLSNSYRKLRLTYVVVEE